MANGYIRTKDLRASVVTSAKIADLNVTTAKIAANAVTAAKLAADQPRTLAFKYSFAVQGGAIAPLTLTDMDGAAQTIPANALIKSVRVETESAMTSTGAGAATVKFGITGNDDAFIGATAYNHATFALDAFKAIESEVPLKVGGSAVSVLMTVAAITLTAGVIYVYVEYVAGH